MDISILRAPTEARLETPRFRFCRHRTAATAGQRVQDRCRARRSSALAILWPIACLTARFARRIDLFPRVRSRFAPRRLWLLRVPRLRVERKLCILQP